MSQRTYDELEAHLDELRAAPHEEGTLALLVRRPVEDAREVLAEATLDPEKGLVGDRWADSAKVLADGSTDRRDQLNVMPYRMVSFLADAPEGQAQAGDQLYLDLDLSVENLPPGSRIAIGEAVIEVSKKPHTGCSKFNARFGDDARAFVNSEAGRELRLRGLNASIVTGGTVRAGDQVRVVSRPGA
jgi:MOSC domain-containing protein YiiM